MIVNVANLSRSKRKGQKKPPIPTGAKANTAFRAVRATQRMGCKAHNRPRIDVQREQQWRLVCGMENHVKTRMEVKRHFGQIYQISSGFRLCDGNETRWQEHTDTICTHLSRNRRVRRQTQRETAGQSTKHMEEKIKPVPAIWTSVTRYVGQ